MTPRRQTRSIEERLSALPQRKDLSLEAGARTLFGEQGGGMQPHIALWVESGTGVVMAYGLFVGHTNPVRASDTSDALLSTLLQPPSDSAVPEDGLVGGVAQRALPGRIRVSDGDLARALKQRVASLGVEVEVVASLPVLDQTFDAVSAYVGEDLEDSPEEQFTWDIDPTVFASLYQAADSFARNAPWEYMDDMLPIVVSVGDDGPGPGADALHGVVLGAGDTVEGIMFYDTRESFQRAVDPPVTSVEEHEVIDVGIEHMRLAGIPVDTMNPEILQQRVLEMVDKFGLPPSIDPDVEMQDATIVYLDPLDEVDPAYVRWLEERGFSVSTRSVVPTFSRTHRDGEPSLPSDREARALTLAVEAVNGFLVRFAEQLKRGIEPDEPLIAPIEVDYPGGRRSIVVCWPGDA